MIEEMAVELLWRWTNRAFGVCSIVARPQRTCYQSSFWGWGPYSGGSMSWHSSPVSQWVLSGGDVSAFVACGTCGAIGTCTCTGMTSVKLPGPVVSVSAVTIDGVDFPEVNWSLDNGRLLRLDGSSWPATQNLELPDTEVGTWSVSYSIGHPVPVGGQIAAGVFALELAKALCGDSGCQLPQRVRSITRQGISMAVLDGFDDLDKGRTGIYLVDSWVSSIVNPPMPSSVRSVDLPATILRHPPVTT